MSEGSFRNETEGPASHRLPQRASKEVLAAPLGRFETKECSKGKPQCWRFERQSLNRARNIKLTGRVRRTASDFSEIASIELESLAQHMLNLSDIDARM